MGTADSNPRFFVVQHVAKCQNNVLTDSNCCRLIRHVKFSNCYLHKYNSNTNQQTYYDKQNNN